MISTWKLLLGSIRANLLLLVISNVIGFLVLLVQGHSALGQLELSAQQMGIGKDIVADILPPPLYLIEPHLLAHQLLEAPKASRDALAEKIQFQKKRYDEQNSLWLARSAQLEVNVAVSLFGAQKAQGDAYWAYLNSHIVSLALAGRDAECRQAFGQLNALYEAHRKGVDATVTVASAWAESKYTEFEATKQRALWVLVVVAAFCVTAAVALFVVVAQRVSKMLGAEPAELRSEMARLALGDLRPSTKAADKGSVLSALQLAQEALKEQVEKTQRTNRELHDALIELNHLVGTDVLTGLWSRRRLEDSLVSEIDRHRRYAQPLSILFIDIDHFKSINDQFGHTAGDQVLVQLSQQIQLALRASDSIARWGGEEFLVICPNSSLETAATLAQRLRSAVAESSFAPVGRVTMSVGVAELHEGESWQEWFQRADAALYAAKGGGRDQVHAAP